MYVFIHMGVNIYTHANIHICRTFNKCLDRLYTYIYMYMYQTYIVYYICVYICVNMYMHTSVGHTS